MDPALPAPGAEALAASRALLERVGAELAARGNWISFARYMELALYEPGLGYYAGGAAKLGAAGDFVTAPEMGRLFARTLARQVASLLEPGTALLEFGAGSGALAAALLDVLPEGHPYLILEPSAELAARQRARLGSRARWLDRLPERFRGVVLANEVLDALPVHALAWTRDGVTERGVCANEGMLAWRERPAAGKVLAAARSLDIELPPSGRYESELGLAARAWIAALAGVLESGAVLIVDYGFPGREYYHPQRSMGTLMCHYRHRAHGDPFYLPGLQDITTHVDYSALAHAADDAGLEVLGYASQAQFLVNCGITELLAETDPGDASRYGPLAAEANRLLSPSEMGELYKVLALGRGVARPLAGFAQGDRTHTL
ncbi:MAG: class I SAM-dependent methyltransferase [Sphingomonadaceae bacterium]